MTLRWFRLKLLIYAYIIMFFQSIWSKYRNSKKIFFDVITFILYSSVVVHALLSITAVDVVLVDKAF